MKQGVALREIYVLAAIHAFAEFVGLNSPEHVEWRRQIKESVIMPFYYFCSIPVLVQMKLLN
ncbi:MAG: hypothetical protein AB7E63_11850 [Parachlamydia sp.]|nr:hypothetical protein pah_c022o042 [Parachlamydia acanthamoebae str. Hall's coccus]